MFSRVLYLVRSKVDGQYLIARAAAPDREDQATAASFLLIFQEHADALSYLNTHGQGVADRFSVESIAGGQLKGLLARWEFTGVGMVKDPLLPDVEFMQVN